MRTAPPLLERERELARISGLLAAVAAGESRLAVVEGPPGAGKSALLRALAAHADERGLMVLRSSGLELERHYPFGVVRQLFEPLIRSRRGGPPGGGQRVMGVTLTGVAVASLALRYGRLVITPRRPVMHVSAVIHPQALKESRQLRTAARRHRVRRLRLTVLTTNAHGRQATVAQLVRVAS